MVGLWAETVRAQIGASPAQVYFQVLSLKTHTLLCYYSSCFFFFSMVGWDGEGPIYDLENRINLSACYGHWD